MTSNSISSDGLAGASFDLLIIGGGIVGAGVARDAALRGLKTLLVDQQDFAAGTSSRSSRLLHGGIRYLAQGRVGLVREASREKKVIHRIAPHLSQPLPFLFPTRRHSPWSRWKLSIGVKLYDWLCGQGNLGPSQSLSRKEMLRRLPGLATENLTGGVRYFDALTNDSRLVIDTLRSAAEHGAQLHNYTRFVDSRRDGKLWRSQLTTGDNRESLEVTSRCIVNAAGPWSDRLPQAKTALRLTKGVHLVVDRQRLPVTDAVVVAEGERILFAIPWGERTILGTTDTDYDGPLESPQCNQDDVEYVLSAANDSFPSANLIDSDVLSSWAGLRPLVADPNGNPSDISRRHNIKSPHPGWWDVTGGKLTTYRLMAEEAVDAIEQFLELPANGCQTANALLLDTNQTDGISSILPPDCSQQVVEHYCRSEWARHLDDVMIRRSGWAYYHSDHLQESEQVATWMGDIFGWSDQERESELASYRALTQHAVLAT